MAESRYTLSSLMHQCDHHGTPWCLSSSCGSRVSPRPPSCGLWDLVVPVASASTENNQGHRGCTKSTSSQRAASKLLLSDSRNMRVASLCDCPATSSIFRHLDVPESCCGSSGLDMPALPATFWWQRGRTQARGFLHVTHHTRR